MEKPGETIKYTFFRLFVGVLSVKDFEEWVYNSNHDLERELDYDFYLSLISFNYHQKDALTQLKHCILPYLDISAFNIWQAKILLTDIIEDRIDIVIATRKLRELYFDTGENFIPIGLGIGYESILEDVPVPSEYSQWNSDVLKEKLKIAELYKADIINDSRSFLESLDGDDRD